MVHTNIDHKEDQPHGWHTFDLMLARIGEPVSRLSALLNGLFPSCLLPMRSNGV